MPLPIQDVERELTHTRRVRFEGYRRADGLWDIEAHLTDIKNHDYPLQTGVRRAGQAIHEMWVRITIDRGLNVIDATAVSDAVPYPGGCDNAPPAYKKLIGLNLRRGFRKKVHELLGGVQGCTHITEMLAGLPTAAIQTFAGCPLKLDTVKWLMLLATIVWFIAATPWMWKDNGGERQDVA